MQVTSALTLYLFIYIIPYELIEAEGILNNKRKINQISSETKWGSSYIFLR